MAITYSRYDWTKSYRWNYDHAPDPQETRALAGASQGDQVLPGDWSFCGLCCSSPLGIPAGPLLNGKWLVHYAQLGFDVLTYKTVRSRHRECYPLPNLQPIVESEVASGQQVRAADRMGASWAISFGMPSMSPEVWRRDIEWTRAQLSSEKVLVVSVVATPEPGWNTAEVAADYARCANWAADSGADCIELNFSCPNVGSVDGQLYQHPAASRQVLQTVREAIADKPLLIKIGFVADEVAASQLIGACTGLAQGISMTNCLACRVRLDGQPMFDGELRGIGGDAIRGSSLHQVQMFARLAKQQAPEMSLIGVGGVFTAEHVVEYLEAGASAVQIATAAMLQPDLALQIKQVLCGRQTQVPASTR
jgi:dihydroorotate dehydrogenase (NAD+) catalytic subunit